MKFDFSLIPEIFFDLIARVIPGGIFILLFFPTFFNEISPYITQSNFSNLKNFLTLGNASLIIVILVVVSYTIGGILIFVGNSLTLFLKKKDSFVYDKCLEIAFQDYLSSNNKLKKVAKDCLPDPILLHDYLRVHFPPQAIRLLKLQAEIRSTQAFGAAFGIHLFIIVINNKLCLYNFNFFTIIFSLLLVGAIICCRYANVVIKKYYSQSIYKSFLVVFLQENK